MGIPNLEETVEQDLPLGKRSSAQRAGMTDVEWRAAIRFDGTDWGWISRDFRTGAECVWDMRNPDMPLCYSL